MAGLEGDAPAMRDLVAAKDWSVTPLGPRAAWPQSLRAIVDLALGSPLAMVVLWGPDLAQIYNDSYAVVLGAKHPAALGQPTRECWPEVWSFNAPIYAAVLRGEARSFKRQKLTIWRSGRAEEAWFDLTFSPVRDDDGAIAGVLVTVVDVTGSCAAEDALRRSEQRYRSLTEATAAIVWTTAGSGEFEEPQSAWSGFTGQNWEACKGSGWLDAIHPDDRARTVEAWRHAVATRIIYRIDHRVRRRDGVYRQMTVRAVPVMDRDGRLEEWVGVHTDVTEERHAEAASRESEERFRNVADHAPVMIWMTDETGFSSYLNRRWHEFTGQMDAEALGYGWLNAVHPDDRAESGAVFHDAITRRAAFRLEYRLRRRDGVYCWAIDSAAPRFGADGAYLGYIGSVIDIEDRREAENMLRASESRFRVLANSVPALVWFAAKDGRIEYLNDRWYAYTGQTPEEALPNGWISVVHPDDAERTASVWAASIAEGARYEIEVRYRRRDGVYRWYMARAEPLRDSDGRVIAWFGTSTDIEDNKRAAQHLSELNLSLEQRVAERTADRDRMWRLSTDIMLVARFDGTALAVNPAWTALLGWSQEELLGKPFLDLVHPDDLAATLAEGEQLAAGLTTRRFENRYRHVDGTYRWLSWTAVPGEGLIHAVGRDITDRKADAEALLRAEEQLRQAQKMEAVGQLTGGMAHDFNNLLAAMQACLQLVARRAGHVEGLEPVLEAGRQAVDRGTKLIRQLMAFARRQDLRPEAVDVRNRLLPMRDLLERALRADIRLDFDLPEGLWFASADPVQLELAVLNLAVNARDAMSAGGRIQIGARNEPGAAGAGGEGGDYVAIWVRDDGPGMSPDVAARAFEPFFTTKGPGHGTGLGLAQVYGFARQSGGSARIETEPGAGATVYVLLPRSLSAEDSAGPTTLTGRRGGGERVLMVEDDPVVLPVIAAALEDLGYRVSTTTSGDEAMGRLEAGEPADILFSDLVMPGALGGLDLARAARRLRPGMAVLLTTGYSEELARARDFPLLPKPYRVEELAEAIAAALDGRSADGGR